ncbi:MAG: nucleotidyltransferase family protein [Bacteroidales bacterium]|nr:nucleotidyltransferase family protein [Bacteroidales bacterium]
MEAMILAAGLGTRLRPLTNDRPKALVEVNGITLLEYNLKRLIGFGFNKIVINIHHFPDMVIDFVRQRTFGADIRFSDEREQLMDTGGALKKAAPLFSGLEPILIHNVDILSTLDLGAVYHNHVGSGASATLLVSRRNTSRQLLFDGKNQLVGWKNQTTGETLWSGKAIEDVDALAFSGIHIVNPELLGALPEARPYPIIPEYLKLAKQHKILAYKHLSDKWLDVGKPETLKKAENFLKH